LASIGEITETLRSPFLRLEPPAALHHARLQPFLDQTNDSPICDPMLDKLDHPIVPDFVEKRLDVQVEDPVHFLLRDPNV
jgi:site-specific DNA recombinase